MLVDSWQQAAAATAIPYCAADAARKLRKYVGYDHGCNQKIGKPSSAPGECHAGREYPTPITIWSAWGTTTPVFEDMVLFIHHIKITI